MRTRIRWNPALVAALTGLALIAVLGILAPLLWNTQATELTGTAREGMSGSHLLGTDALGRDVLARTLVATRLTLVMTLAATALAALVGIVLGTAIWVSGPRVRELGLRLIDVLVSYPALILALVIAAVVGAGPTASVVAIGLGGCPSFARLTANMAASVAQRDFVTTARLMGVPPHRVLSRHLLPNISGPLLVLLSVAFANVLVALSGLSFLGLGVQSPQYDWGALLNSGLEALYTNPAEAIGPAVAITVTGILAGFVGDGLAAALDPRDTPTKPKPVREGTHRRPTGATAPTDALVAVDGLTVELPDGTRLVDHVSFHIRPGEIIGLVGESGSGKSLTAMAVAHLLPQGLTAHAAELRVGELDLTRPHTLDAARLATDIGIVYQDPSASLNPALRLGGQLTETLRVHQGVGRTEARERALKALDQVHIKDPERVVRQYPHELSGGMRQRAMIAAAVLPGPRLLVADEPTTALDVTVQAEVLRLLAEVNEANGTGMLFISHDIGVVGTLCHRVLVMYAGRIVEELDAADLRAGRAHHPYTQALLAASPRLEDAQEVSGRPLATIPGRPPTPRDRPAGCAFAARCHLAAEICATRLPPLVDKVACHVVNGTPATAAPKETAT
ncbi:dipeptide/oligopeptide/nickel ABC transporter permease/ATP-binding protein [Streptomyces endophyticus]|uniref:Dipeptide/oligopeptide/nickel ABC transporter permease/ATP-binding protein n=1 Tax=Streptomyces endophyticus TaxID=714166 RepID=A0ABU6FD75_9ACTN|nr:dipeptide/oligopeptide/nickel ABC transporter permease/ATP-binding protein [Streptomyces endophyticus]MEB8340786.1 dipeptide/oligopeptide/nickel ABC transporter permease/ATP-binding protein [Streptomyces endophyticus]